jgi:transcriptional regulator with XRE-family HTH domain
MYGMAETDLGTRIRRARERKRWSQVQLAAALGVGTRSVGRWERGEAIPRSSLGALEAALTPYFTVNGGTPEPPPDPDDREMYFRLMQVKDMTHDEAIALIEGNWRTKRRIA